MDNTKLKNRLEDKVQGLKKPSEIPVPVNSTYVALTNNALGIIRENLKNQPLSFDLFDIVKAPSGGSTVFSVPSLSGVDAEKELTGIVLDYATPRAYWDTPEPVEGTPPVCLSRDSIVSTDGKACSQCPYNDFGSKDGESGAKACKESVMIFLLCPNNILPLLVRVPVTNKARFLKYTARLVGNLTPISGVVTRITLEKATSKGGKPCALFNFEAVSILGQEEGAYARTYAKQLMEIVNAADMKAELSEAG